MSSYVNTILRQFIFSEEWSINSELPLLISLPIEKRMIIQRYIEAGVYRDFQNAIFTLLGEALLNKNEDLVKLDPMAKMNQNIKNTINDIEQFYYD